MIPSFVLPGTAHHWGSPHHDYTRKLPVAGKRITMLDPRKTKEAGFVRPVCSTLARWRARRRAIIQSVNVLPRPIDSGLVAWAGRPLDSYETVLNYIRTTRTAADLRLLAHLVRKYYSKGAKIPDTVMRRLPITKDPTPPRWNYVINSSWKREVIVARPLSTALAPSCRSRMAGEKRVLAGLVVLVVVQSPMPRMASRRQSAI
jgi:hypothetical protein